LLYTSGSTGKPKGVVHVSVRDCVNQIESERGAGVHGGIRGGEGQK
jgi:long-subunit acyl-CoA synthetase (AMP-forming)